MKLTWLLLIFLIAGCTAERHYSIEDIQEQIRALESRYPAFKEQICGFVDEGNSIVVRCRPSNPDAKIRYDVIARNGSKLITPLCHKYGCESTEYDNPENTAPLPKSSDLKIYTEDEDKRFQFCLDIENINGKTYVATASDYEAIFNHSPESCERLKTRYPDLDPYVADPVCYGCLAIMKRDAGYCEKVENKDKCLLKAGKALDVLSYCRAITAAEERNECIIDIAYDTGDLEICNELPSSSWELNSKESCLIETVLYGPDASEPNARLCDVFTNITLKNKCLDEASSWE